MKSYLFARAVATGLLALIRSGTADGQGRERTIFQFQHTAWTTKDGAPSLIWAMSQTIYGFDVAVMVLKDASILVGAGPAVGIATSLLGANIIGNFLCVVKPRDPTALVVALAVLLATDFFAVWSPARRAARVDPIVALRSE